MESYRIEVGRMHGVKPANIVGAIANEAGLESRYIGRIDIRDDHSVLDLPAEMPHEILQHLKRSGYQDSNYKCIGSTQPKQPHLHGNLSQNRVALANSRRNRITTNQPNQNHHTAVESPAIALIHSRARPPTSFRGRRAEALPPTLTQCDTTQ